MNNSNKQLLVCILVPAAIGGLCLVFLLMGLHLKVYVVVSESMLPSLKTGDALAISKSRDSCSSFDCLKDGDIIVFKSTRLNNPEPAKTIVHRIEAISQVSDGKRVLITKGDANPQPIKGVDYPVTEDMYIGRVIYVLPYAGLLIMYMDLLAQVLVNPIFYFTIGAMITTILLLEHKKKQTLSEKVSESTVSHYTAKTHETP
jgi:signal peptidase I